MVDESHHDQQDMQKIQPLKYEDKALQFFLVRFICKIFNPIP